MALVGSFKKLPPLGTSKLDMPLARPKTVSASAIMYLRGEDFLGEFFFLGEEWGGRETTMQTPGSVRVSEWCAKAGTPTQAHGEMLFSFKL